MTLNKTLYAVGVFGVCTLSAQAQFLWSSAQPVISIAASATPVSGTLDFAFSSSSSAYTLKGGAPADGGSFDTFTSLTFGTPNGLTTGAAANFGLGTTTQYVHPTGTPVSLAQNGIYNVIVDWTLSSATAGEQEFATFTVNVNPGSGFQPEALVGTINVAQVPEPAQAIASVALLSCGGLVFIGRRFMSKKA